MGDLLSPVYLCAPCGKALSACAFWRIASSTVLQVAIVGLRYSSASSASLTTSTTRLRMENTIFCSPPC
jgi:hypothetical protein